VIRARQDISKADRDILGTAAGEVISACRRRALAPSIFASVSLSLIRVSADSSKPDYLILRRRGTKAETLPADEDDLLQPGDVVRVQPRMNTLSPSAFIGRCGQGAGTAFRCGRT
jgi:exopolysaccharide production protein ExoF